MSDTRTPQQRRAIMQAVGTKNTQPELIVRKLLTAANLRYRLHAKNLPGKPDIVFPGKKKAIFVHGCFWHSHGCSKGKPPKSKADYWIPKLAANAERDIRNQNELLDLGWKALVVWQCETKNLPSLQAKILAFVDGQ